VYEVSHSARVHADAGLTRARFANPRARSCASPGGEPRRFDNVPLHRTLDTILVQAAQFRDRADRTAVLISAPSACPTPRFGSARGPRTDERRAGHGQRGTGAAARPAHRVVRRVEPDGLLHRSWRLASRLARTAPGGSAPPGLDRVPGHGAAPRPLFPRPLALSDVLAADRVEPRDSLARRWRDFFLEPNGGRFLPATRSVCCGRSTTWHPTPRAWRTSTCSCASRSTRSSGAPSPPGSWADSATRWPLGARRRSGDARLRAPGAGHGGWRRDRARDGRTAGRPEGRYTIGVTVRDRRTVPWPPASASSWSDAIRRAAAGVHDLR